MAIDKVRTYLDNWNRGADIIEPSVSTATVEEAAAALGVNPERIAKSLSFKIEDNAIIVVVAGDARIDNKKYKEEFGVKAKMLSAEEIEPLTGFQFGGVCPFALPESVKVYLDESMKRFITVFPACGTPSSAIELTMDELFLYAKAEHWVDVCHYASERLSFRD